MPSASLNRNQFARALKQARRATGLTQEDFAVESSRTYVSTLERGLQSPTLNKVDGLARVMGVHPLTLLLMAYSGSAAERKQTLATVTAEIEKLKAMK